MAKQQTVIPITGKLGNMIGFRRNGRYFMRAAPTLVRQSPASKRAAGRFGIASKMGALVRQAFHDLTLRNASDLANALTRALVLSKLDVASALQGFQFNDRMPTGRLLPIPPRFTKDGMLHLAPQEGAIGNGPTLEIKVVAAKLNFATQTLVAIKSMTCYAGPHFTGTSMPVSLPGEGTLVVCLQARRLDKHGVPAGRENWASGILLVQVEAEAPIMVDGNDGCLYSIAQKAVLVKRLYDTPAFVLRE